MKIYSNKPFSILACVFFATSIFLFAPSAYASTIIKGDITENTVWNKDGSPYFIKNVVQVPAGLSLSVGPGVSLIGDGIYSQLNFYNGSSVNFGGTPEQRVKISGIHMFGTGNLNMNNTDTDSQIQLYLASSTIARSTVSYKNGGGILLYRGKSMIENSRIEGNGVLGIWVIWPDPDHASSFSVHNSVIANNGMTAIKNNDDTRPFHAENNWWGSPNAPSSVSTTSQILGLVDFRPWLGTEPPPLSTSTVASVCCSSVLFLPGIEGTGLFKPESVLGMTVTNTLWPPNTNSDVDKLRLDATGSSSDSSIYSGGALGTAFRLVDIYGKFMIFLDSMVGQGLINEWKSYGYDWRKPIAEVVAGPEQKATTTEYLVREVQSLAERSKTGKVTIIAHSTGGLVAKYLVKTLADMGQADLIDSIISVAVPYLGTPQALSSALHGDDTSLAYGLFARQDAMRDFGKNMASLYSLMPSATYFSKVLSPSIAFASTTISGLDDGSYPQTIHSAADQIAFVTDSHNVRVEPTMSDVSRPIRGNEVLAVAADVLHSIIDPFTWPATISRWAIVGWNRNTIDGITYIASNKHKNNKSLMGDDTVIAPSAVYNSGTVTTADLKQISSIEHTTIKHMNIMEASTTESAIKGMMEHKPDQSQFPLPPGMTWGEPDYSKEPTRLVVSTHSPVELHIYDEQGRHTGIIPKPAGLEEQDAFEGGVDPSFLTFTENNIPDSNIELEGDDPNDRETYIDLPDDGQKYTVKIRGLAAGKFDYDIERVRGSLLDEGATLGTAVFYDVPVFANTLASNSIQYAPADQNSTTTPGFASSTSPLLVDFDGNGSTDATVEPAATSSDKIDPHLFILTLETALRSSSNSGAPNSSRIKAAINYLEALDKNQSRIPQATWLDLLGNLSKMTSKVSNSPEIITLIENFMR